MNTFKGLEDTIVASTKISKISEDRQQIYYCGYPLDYLLKNCDFLDVAFLLWNQELPSELEKRTLEEKQREFMLLSPRALALIEALDEKMHPTDALRTLMSAVAVPNQNGADRFDSWQDEALFWMSQVGSLTAALHCKRTQRPFSYPDDNKLLNQLLGQETPNEKQKLFDRLRILYAEHELNAATFTCRVVASTQANMCSAFCAALSALSGPLHGGAVEHTLLHYMKNQSPEEVSQYLQDLIEQKQKVMGFGHRVYMKNGDPRFAPMKEILAKLADSQTVSQLHLNICNELKAQMHSLKGLQPNLDLAGAPCFYGFGFEDPSFYVALISCSRIAGWAAHFQEERELKKIIRPRSTYSGKTHDTYQV